MKKLFVVLIVLLIVPSLALAGKPEKPPRVDLEALLETETQERIAADSALGAAVNVNTQDIQTNAADIATNAQNIQPNASVMYLKSMQNDGYGNGELPPECPSLWIEAGIEEIIAAGHPNYVRTCYNIENSCTVMVLEARDTPGFPLPGLCPSGWEEAGLSRSWSASQYAGNWQRVCYYCSQ